MTRRIIGRDIDLVIADKMAMELEEEIFVQSHMNNISLNKEHVSLFLDAMKYLLQRGYTKTTQSMEDFFHSLNILYMRGYDNRPGFDIGAIYGTLHMINISEEIHNN